MSDYWFDATALAAEPARRRPRLRAVLPGARLSLHDHEALASFAETNGFGYWSVVEPGVARLPVLNGSREAVVQRHESPGIEFGNNGMRFVPTQSGLPSRHGYIAIRHGLDLPPLTFKRHTVSSTTPLGVAVLTAEIATMLGGDAAVSSSNSSTRLERHHQLAAAKSVKRSERKVAKEAAKAAAHEIVAAQGFETLVAKGSEAEATALLTADARALLSELALSFDLHARGGWLQADCYFGDISTTDPEVWAWAFAAASRMIDLLAHWGADVGELRELACYTPRRVARPASLDAAGNGVLSRWR